MHIIHEQPEPAEIIITLSFSNGGPAIGVGHRRGRPTGRVVGVFFVVFNFPTSYLKTVSK
jgi:hypothetical protein